MLSERREEFFLPLCDSRRDNFFRHREREMREERIEWRRERRKNEMGLKFNFVFLACDSAKFDRREQFDRRD